MSSDAQPSTVGARLAQVAARHRAKVALIEGTTAVSYAELDAAATAIARRLPQSAEQGRVALFFEAKIPAIEALFGVARSGHAYVMLDAGDPEERLRVIVADCAPVAILTEAPLVARAMALAPAGCATIDVATSFDAAAAALPDVRADATLYLYYTSGSTGRPKGARQTHRNLLFFADAYARSLALGERDRHSLVYTLSFNAANMDIYGALLHGATLCAHDVRRDGIATLADWLDGERVTVLHAVPTVFREMCARLPAGRLLPHLRAVDLGGETVFESDVDHFRAHTLDSCTFVNQLASTEVGLIAQHQVGHATPRGTVGVVPVGRCPDGVRVEIRRADGTAAAIGEPGEIVVCSPHVSPGYWRRPELDAAAFSADPANPGWRRYNSGDVGFVDAAGNLNFQGRQGGRVKVRGHSVDLMEIEAALCECPGVSKAAVVSLGVDTGADSARIVAYVAADLPEDRDPQLLRRRLALRLPGYMLPAAFVFVDALPLTATGKVDRLALAALTPGDGDVRREVTPPRDEIERGIAAVFGELLKLDPIGRDDDFFLLGGDSLSGVELQVRLRGLFGVHIGNFQADSTVARIAAKVREAVSGEAPPTRAMPVLCPLWQQGDEPPLFLVHGRHGQAFVSPHFMRLLGNDQPVWVFQARGLDGVSPPHATVEAMADDYVVELRRVRPRGPYFIGALCAGGYVAAVMARTLREAGETVLPLLLLDPPARLLGGGYAQMSEERFIAKMSARRAQGGTAGPADDLAYMKTVRRVALAFEQAIARYHPRPYDGAALVLSSSRRIQGEAGLREVFSGPLQRYEVGATHADALDPRNAVFASHLMRCLALIRDAARSSRPGAATAVTDIQESREALAHSALPVGHPGFGGKSLELRQAGPAIRAAFEQSAHFAKRGLGSAFDGREPLSQQVLRNVEAGADGTAARREPARRLRRRHQ